MCFNKPNIQIVLEIIIKTIKTCDNKQKYNKSVQNCIGCMQK